MASQRDTTKHTHTYYIPVTAHTYMLDACNTNSRNTGNLVNSISHYSYQQRKNCMNIRHLLSSWQKGTKGTTFSTRDLMHFMIRIIHKLLFDFIHFRYCFASTVHKIPAPRAIKCIHIIVRHRPIHAQQKANQRSDQWRHFWKTVVHWSS